jgi:hypothetical protein
VLWDLNMANLEFNLFRKYFSHEKNYFGPIDINSGTESIEKNNSPGV